MARETFLARPSWKQKVTTRRYKMERMQKHEIQQRILGGIKLRIEDWNLVFLDALESLGLGLVTD